MTNAEVIKAIPVNSTTIVPAFARMIGVMYVRYDAIKANGGDLVEAAYNLWSILETINLQTIILGDCHHASIAISNEKRKVADIIKEDIGIDPILDNKKFKLITHTKNHMNWYEEIKYAY